MTIKKTLTKIILTGALSLGTVGCYDHEEYHYKGKIDNLQVEFYEGTFGIVYLSVLKSNGTKITYVDRTDDFKVDKVTIEKNGQSTTYKNDVFGKQILKEAQKQFDTYLEKIIKIKSNYGLENLK